MKTSYYKILTILIVDINLWHDHFLDLRSYYLSPHFLLQAFPHDVKDNLKLSKIKPIHAEWLVNVYSLHRYARQM